MCVCICIYVCVCSRCGRADSVMDSDTAGPGE